MSNDLSTPSLPASTVRAYVYRQVFDPTNKQGMGKKLDGYISTLIILNLIALLVEQVPTLYAKAPGFFHIFDVFSIIVFTIEYVLRLYVAPEDPEFKGARLPRFAYFKSPFALIDLAAILPFYLAAFIQIDLRMLRALRLLRLFKLARVLIPAWKEFRELNKDSTLRQKVYNLLNPTPQSGALHEYVDLFIVFWVLVSVAAVILESVESVHYVLNVEFVLLDGIAVAIFTTEYILRLYTCTENPSYRHWVAGRLAYARSPSAVVDGLAVLPFFLEPLLHSLLDLRFLRIFRLLRLLKLTRYTTAGTTLIRVLSREWPVIAASTFIMMLLVILTASLGYLFEHEAQPEKFENIPQSIYWAVVTLASVGYGDISPVTPIGRIATVILALVGLGIFAVPAGILATAFNDELRRHRESIRNQLLGYLSDGVLEEEEKEQLYRSARALRLTHEEVDLMIERARLDAEAATKAAQEQFVIPYHMMENNPSFSADQFKQLATLMRQVAAVSDHSALNKIFHDAKVTSEHDRELWSLVLSHLPQK